MSIIPVRLGRHRRFSIGSVVFSITIPWGHDTELPLPSSSLREIVSADETSRKYYVNVHCSTATTIVRLPIRGVEARTPYAEVVKLLKEQFILGVSMMETTYKSKAYRASKRGNGSDNGNEAEDTRKYTIQEMGGSFINEFLNMYNFPSKELPNSIHGKRVSEIAKVSAVSEVHSTARDAVRFAEILMSGDRRLTAEEYENAPVWRRSWYVEESKISLINNLPETVEEVVFSEEDLELIASVLAQFDSVISTLEMIPN